MEFVGGLPETACGTGSTLSATTEIRSFLPGLLRKLGCQTLVDAPCGDLNWISRVDLSFVDYIGLDVRPENIAAAERNAAAMRARSSSIRRIDVVDEPMPTADVVLCRDFLQHIPNAMVLRVLRNISASGARWLLATSHDVERNEDLDRAGGFRPLNLLIEPFCLVPTECLADSGRSLIVVEVR